MPASSDGQQSCEVEHDIETHTFRDQNIWHQIDGAVHLPPSLSVWKGTVIYNGQLTLMLLHEVHAKVDDRNGRLDDMLIPGSPCRQYCKGSCLRTNRRTASGHIERHIHA